MTKAKKVLLFIVEGPTDENSLNPIFKKIFHNSSIRFHLVCGDITTKAGITSNNAVSNVNLCLKAEMKKYHFKKKDINKIYHIIDTDGAFIDDASVVHSDIGHIHYEDTVIQTPDVLSIIQRNHTKQQISLTLSKTKAIQGIPYSLYFMSRNLEHVLHDDGTHLSNNKKMYYADKFAEKYENDIESFKKFIKDPSIAVSGSFKETWDFIFKDNNSLKRCSNLHLIL